jgi:Ca-activated chloride channel homolog
MSSVRRWPPLVAALALLAGSMPAGLRAQNPIRSGVDLVSLHVTVMDGTRYVTDLEKDELQVFEDGVAQDLTFFSRGEEPIALAVLIDTSASMERSIATAQEAAIGFTRRMRPGDLMEVVEFSGQVNVLQTFTTDAAALERAIRSTVANGSTALYNAMYIALRSLQKARARGASDVRREAIVVLSDGDDTSSLISYDEVLDLARRSETAIYAIGLRATEGQRRDLKQAEYVLRQLAQQTGGRAFFPTTAAELPKVYEQIAQELAAQYVIGYVSKNPARDGAWRRLSVRVLRANMVGRTRQGYFAPGEGR